MILSTTSTHISFEERHGTGDERKLQLIGCLDFPVRGRYLRIYPSMTSEATYNIFLFTLRIAHNCCSCMEVRTVQYIMWTRASCSHCPLWCPQGSLNSSRVARCTSHAASILTFPICEVFQIHAVLWEMRWRFYRRCSQD